MDILGQEQPIIYKMDDIFDPTTAQMFLNAQQNYVNAMRQDYLQGVQDMKDFIKENRDFTSPFSKDSENYYNLTMGGANQLMDSLREQGIDPLRSVEGRNAIQRYIMSRPYGELTKLKQSAEIGKEYLKEIARLKEMGKYDQEFEDFATKLENGTPFSEYDTIAAGKSWQRSAPYQYQDLQKDTDNWYNGSQPLYKGMQGGNRVYELNMDDLKKMAEPYIQGYINTTIGKYRISKIKDQLQRSAIMSGKMYTPNELQDAAVNVLKDNIANAQRKYLRKKTFEADPFALDDHRTANEIYAYKEKAKYETEQSGNKYSEPDIFKEADAKVNNDGVYFEKKNMYNHKIDPVSGKNIQYINGVNQQYFSATSKDMPNLLSPAETVINKDGKHNVEQTITVHNGPEKWNAGTAENPAVYNRTSRFNIIPTGELRARTYKVKGKEYTKYYISCTVSQVYKKNIVTTDESGAAREDVRYRVIKDKQGNDKTFYMEVKKRGAQYTTPGKNKTFK